MKKMILSFAFLGLSMAGAKTYSLNFSSPVNIGVATIKSGEYKLELKGDRVLLKDGKMVDSFPVQVQNETRKFDNTSVSVSSRNGTAQIEEIHLDGTTIKLVFSN